MFTFRALRDSWRPDRLAGFEQDMPPAEVAQSSFQVFEFSFLNAVSHRAHEDFSGELCNVGNAQNAQQMWEMTDGWFWKTSGRLVAANEFARFAFVAVQLCIVSSTTCFRENSCPWDPIEPI